MRNLFSIFLTTLLAGSAVFGGCREVGFHELDVSARTKASEQTARDVMSELQRGLRSFYEERHHYPLTNEAHLYDSIRNFMNPQLDPVHLYRNDNGKGYFIAVGGRGNRIIYRYPATVGPGIYTLYWVGPNGVDEEGEGDDLQAWDTGGALARYERQHVTFLHGGTIEDKLVLLQTGTNVAKDSMRFQILEKDSLVYSDSWPLSAYFHDRPDLSQVDRNQVIREEAERFFRTSAFEPIDSLIVHPLGTWVEVKPKSPALSDMLRSNDVVFNYFQGVNSRGVAWVPSLKKFVVIWKS